MQGFKRQDSFRNFTDVGEGVVTDSHFTENKEVFNSPIAIVKNLNIDDRLLLELAPGIKDIFPPSKHLMKAAPECSSDIYRRLFRRMILCSEIWTNK